MARKSTNNISLRFIFFVIIAVAGISYYLLLPREKQEKPKYEDLLESRQIVQNTPYDTSKLDTYIQEISPVKTNTPDYTPPVIPQAKVVTPTTYNQLLDSIRTYPVNSPETIKKAVDKLIVYKGYKAGLIDVKSTDINQSQAKTAGTYMVANFDFKTGNLYISPQLLSGSTKEEIIAIIAHELDHFDKLAKVCKYMGTDKFKELFERNRITNIDTNFWTKASQNANIDGFDAKYYQDALERFITQYDLELVSSYSNFYRMSENMRNPLEISAYDVSDYVYHHYNIKVEEGPMRKLTKKFNDVDWAIYDQIQDSNILRNERIPVFDYFFMKAITNKYPELNQKFLICDREKDGDLTTFWVAFETKFKSFYGKTQMDDATTKAMCEVLDLTAELARKGLQPKQAAIALKYKTNTLLSNLVYPNALKNLKATTLDYLKYIKTNNIQDDKQELKSILTLIAIENKLYKSTENKELSLYYINIPQELLELYNISDKRQFLLSIYKNSYLKSQCNTTQESECLSKMVNNSRLNTRFDY